MAFNDSFFILKLLKPDKKQSDFVRVEKCIFKSTQDMPINIKNGELLIYNYSTTTFDCDLYKCKTHTLPYEIRDTLIKNIAGSSLFDVSNQLASTYLDIVTVLNYVVSNIFSNVQVVGCIYCYDFCLLSSDATLNLELVSNFINDYLKEYLSVDMHKYDFEKTVSKNSITTNQERIRQNLLSGRQFAKYNPRVSDYYMMTKKLNKIECDSIDKKEELSLISSLLVKDLVEETHLYWMYESGEVRYENAEKNCILSNRNQQYFECFDMFCEQASSKNVFHDWVWCLVFLTQTLLASFLGRNQVDSDGDDNYSNFFGFIPIFNDIKDDRSELISLFSQHISRKFCHGFLVVPVNSIQNLPAYFPAYIHEFFHYIPPSNREKRNDVILKLILHSLLYDYKKSLPKDVYNDIFGIFKECIIKTFSSYNFEDTAIFSCDSMEYMERIRSVFLKLNIVKVLNHVSSFISDKYSNQQYDLIIDYITQKIGDVFIEKARAYTNTFIFFFREIRSDIAMCLLLGIGLETYIEILAKEPLFAALSAENCADSTILRFGFMCRFLYKKGDLFSKEKKSNNFQVWLQDCCDIIDKNIQLKFSENDFESAEKYKNLKSYLYGYVSISFESEDNQFTPKSESLLENIIKEANLIDEWCENIFKYANRPFAEEIKTLYKTYTETQNPEDKLMMLFGLRILFRDLYSYNPHLDLM